MERSWRRFKQLLRRLDAITSCCGSHQQRRARRGTHTVLGDGDDYDNEYLDNLPFQEEVEEEEEVVGAAEFGCVVIREAAAAAEDSDPDQMDLATALAAERQLRASTTMSLMRCEDGGDDDDGGEGDDEGQNDDSEEGDGGWGWCCVCMEGRLKLAAFIPCGHTFCRQCARELWFGRASCPLCNRPVRDVLRIF